MKFLSYEKVLCAFQISKEKTHYNRRYLGITIWDLLKIYLVEYQNW